MKISVLILSGFFLILVLFTITTYINHRQSKLINAHAYQFSESSRTLRHSNRFQRNLANMVSGLRGYLLTSESSFVESYDSAVTENNEILAELSKTPMPDRQRQLLGEIVGLRSTWLTEFAQPLFTAKANAEMSDSSAASFDKLYHRLQATNIEKDIQQKIQRNFREFTNIEYASRDVEKSLLESSVEQTRRTSFLLTAASIAIGMAIAIFLAGHISSRIVKLTRMADSIAAGNYDAQLSETGKDEMGQLTKALNNMARTLAENFSMLQRKNAELDQFAHIVSHDLKAPLRGIDNVVSWIEEDHSLDLPPKVAGYVAVIKGRVARAEDLLNGILSYSRAGRGQQPMERVNIRELLEEIKENLPHIPGLSLVYPASLPVLYTERLPLFQIFSNLIVNACKHNTNADPVVAIRVDEDQDILRFSVADNGPGIAEAYHQKVFMMFQTLQDPGSFESTGIGLAIVKKILTERMLNIEIDSAPGRGSVFSFTWPKSYAL